MDVLNHLRQEIDTLDRELIQLFEIGRAHV